MRTALAAALASAVLLASAPEAMANGRFPESNAIFFSPGDAQQVLLRTTFGLVISADRGKSWDWVCERSIGLAGIEDPMFSVTPNGTILGATFMGLAASSDRSCNYQFVDQGKDAGTDDAGTLEGLVFIDLTSRPSTPGKVIAFASSYSGQDDAGLIFFKSTLYETSDEGKSFAPLGPSLDPTLLGETVDVTPSDPDRIYLTGVRNPGTAAAGVFLTSRDHGKTFEEHALPLISPERAPYIAAVDPNNADRVYVRTANASDKPSRLLLSDDAGKTFRTIYTAQGPLAGFALSADGTRVYIGGPRDGLRVASTTDFAFQQRSTVEVSCLALSSDGLWTCSNERSGFVVGLTKDEGATFETKLHFCDIRGPLACAPGSTTHTECTLGGTASNSTPPWPPQKALLGCGNVDPADAGAQDAGGEPNETEALVGGGGCSLRPPSPTPLAALIAGTAAAIAFVRRRRR